MNMNRILFRCIVTTAVLTTAALGQAPSLTPRQNTSSSKSLLYRYLFHEVSRLPRIATEAKARGGNERAVLSYYRSKLTLAESEYAILVSTAELCNRAIAVQDELARPVIARFAAQVSSANNSKAPPPPVPEELQSLQYTRNKIIDQYVAKLSQSLGADSFRRLDDGIEIALRPRTSSAVTLPVVSGK